MKPAADATQALRRPRVAVIGATGYSGGELCAILARHPRMELVASFGSGVIIGKAGVRGIALSFVNYLDELPYFRDEVLPRLVRLGARAAH